MVSRDKEQEAEAGSTPPLDEEVSVEARRLGLLQFPLGKVAILHLHSLKAKHWLV